MKLFTTILQGSLPTKDLERSEGRFVCKIGLFPRERCLAPGGVGRNLSLGQAPRLVIFLFNYRARDNINKKITIYSVVWTHLTRVGCFDRMAHYKRIRIVNN